jgi:uncharacterized protein (TIGR03083 family)
VQATTTQVRHEPIGLVADEQMRLRLELATLGRQMWGHVSGCAGWSTAQVVAHLVAGAELYQRSLGWALAEPAVSPAAAATATALAEFAERQARLAEQPPAVLLEAFASSGERLVRTFERLSTSDLERPAWHPSGPRTVGTLVGLRAFELGFHGWDVRTACDPRATIRPTLRPFLVAFVRQAQQRLCRPPASLSLSGRFEVGDDAWSVAVQQGRVSEVPAARSLEVRVRTDANTFLLLATRRRGLAEVAAYVLLTGEMERAATFVEATSFSV